MFFSFFEMKHQEGFGFATKTNGMKRGHIGNPWPGGFQLSFGIQVFFCASGKESQFF